MVTDQVADFLTRIRNAVLANHRIVESPASNLKVEIAKVLYAKGYIRRYKVIEDGPFRTIKIALKYDKISRQSAISHLQRVSKPGLRKYSKSGELPRVLNGMGVAILSTSQGVMTDKEARRLNVGGEILCHVY
jgi:small subunit ribosomal protein S8